MYFIRQNACLNYRFTTIALRSAPCSVRLTLDSSFIQVFMYVCKAVKSLSTQFGWCAPGSFHHQAPASRVYPPALMTILLLSFALHLGFTLSLVPNTSRSQFVLFVPSLLHPEASLTATTASRRIIGGLHHLSDATLLQHSFVGELHPEP